MAARITLPFWPTSLNNLSWSSDNLIAAGGGQHVAIVVPRLQSVGPDGSHWDVVVIKANAFTASEVPLHDPLSFVNFSIGEELSHRHVCALEWSSSGLAKFGACALAILSTNHVLSIWECDGRPEVKESWKRKVMVNHAVRDYYQSKDPISDDAKQEKREEAQVRQRIRAFAWSAITGRDCEVAESVQGYIRRHEHYLAVSTEAQDILMFRVDSPHDVLRPDHTEWKLTLTHSFNVGAEVQSLLQTLHGDVLTIEETEHTSSDTFIADNLAWCPSHESGHGEGELAFITNGKLYSFPVEPDRHNRSGSKANTNGGVRCLLLGRSDVSGPLKFNQKTGQLIAFCADTVFCIHFDRDEADEPCWNPGCRVASVTEHHLDGRWDEISGVAVTRNGSDMQHINLVSHMSTASAKTTALQLPLDPEAASSNSHWQQAINESRATYSAEYDLAGNVQERIWGIAASPLGDYIATCSSMLPSDAITHVIQSEQSSALNITKETGLAEHVLLPPQGGVSVPSELSAEALVFSLQRQLERTKGAEVATVVTTLQRAMGFPGSDLTEVDDDWESGATDDLDSQLQAIRLRVYWQSDMLQQRLKRLAELVLSGRQGPMQLSEEGYRQLLGSVLMLSEQFSSHGGPSGRIRNVYRAVQDRLDKRKGDRADGGGVREDATESEQWSESCTICKQRVPFESLKWARCATGHQFSRCSLTFLAIQGPGISKFCRICNAQYLNEAALPEFVPTSDEGIEMTDLANEQTEGTSEQWVQVTQNAGSKMEPKASLARLLFAACDVCIFCGGRFVA